MRNLLIKAMSVMFTVMVFALPVMAQAADASRNFKGEKGAVFGSIAVGIAAAGAALGDSRAVAAACEGTARNPGAGPRIFTSMMLGLVLIETLVLITFAAAFSGL